jgi:hypothetical protein
MNTKSKTSTTAPQPAIRRFFLKAAMIVQNSKVIKPIQNNERSTGPRPSHKTAHGTARVVTDTAAKTFSAFPEVRWFELCSIQIVCYHRTHKKRNKRPVRFHFFTIIPDLLIPTRTPKIILFFHHKITSSPLPSRGGTYSIGSESATV